MWSGAQQLSRHWDAKRLGPQAATMTMTGALSHLTSRMALKLIGSLCPSQQTKQVMATRSDVVKIFGSDDPLAYYARNLIERVHAKPMENFGSQSQSPDFHYPQETSRPFLKYLRDYLKSPETFCKEKSRLACEADDSPAVGIIGAGVGGLYAALMLDSLEIKYEILEASDRVGGRINTYHFRPNSQRDPTGTHDYFELGAMRFPNLEIAQRLKELLTYPPLNDKENGPNLQARLIPYHINALKDNTYLFYNGVRHRKNDNPISTFHAEELGIPGSYIAAGYARIMQDVINPFVEGLRSDLHDADKGRPGEGWKFLMKHDSYSVRSYMAHKYIPSAELHIPRDHLPTKVINWLEIRDSSAVRFDQALSEAVLGAIAFGSAYEIKPQYSCLEGGTQGLTNDMRAYIDRRTSKTAIITGKQVTAITESEESHVPQLVITINDKEKRKYNHVISTVPIPVLRFGIDLSGCGLSVIQMNGLRDLSMTPSVKIGVKFKSAWWTSGNDLNDKPVDIIGGQSSTDLPIRSIVYPSYGIKGEDGLPNNGPAVLLASYVLTEDAAHFGVLIRSDKADDKERVKKIVLQDLAAVHNFSFDTLKSQYLDHYAHDWADNLFTMGAFAHFGPGKFDTFYNSLTHPAAHGMLHFAGEALSIRHGWVIGALNSSWRAVCEVVLKSYPDKAKYFYQKWGFDQDWARKKRESNSSEDHVPGVPINLADDLLLERLDLFVQIRGVLST